jgi:hypothetical protein
LTHLVGPGDVDLETFDALILGGLDNGGTIAVHQGHVGPGLRKRLSGGPSDAAGGTGDGHHLAREIKDVCRMHGQSLTLTPTAD